MPWAQKLIEKKREKALMAGFCFSYSLMEREEGKKPNPMRKTPRPR
jgi:hypothetical protein